MRGPVSSDGLLLVEEVAREVRAPVETIRWWIRTGKLPASKPGRRLLIRRSDLQRLLAAREKPDATGDQVSTDAGNAERAPKPGLPSGCYSSPLHRADTAANPRLLAALGYARRGLAVFPCRPLDKRPATKHGFKDATTDKGVYVRPGRRIQRRTSGLLRAGSPASSCWNVNPPQRRRRELRGARARHGPLPRRPRWRPEGAGGTSTSLPRQARCRAVTSHPVSRLRATVVTSSPRRRCTRAGSRIGGWATPRRGWRPVRLGFGRSPRGSGGEALDP